uniref:Flap endonuclease 1 n=1 Tax=Acrobeloides nanus TaxID=290746 RepID=A0A914BX29_9BILA
MGIQNLMKVIGDHAANAIHEYEMKHYFGRKIAIDASMSLYQFLIAIRQDGAQLQTETGETTSHLNGMFYRTIRMMEHGIKPVFVFDGAPPELKKGELDKRLEKREEAEKQRDEAKEKGDLVSVDKFERRLVKVTREQNQECRRLLTLMGVPVVESPCEAESQCAELVQAGKVFATATEDMDALTFGSKVLVRHMTFSEAKKMPIKEFNLELILKGFEMDMDQFIDLCILLGCDYCPSIRGIGPKKAFELISKHKSIENVLENIDQTKYPPPENWKFAAARKEFLEPKVLKGGEVELTWKEPQTDELIQFLCVEKGFNEDRIRSALGRLEKGRQNSAQVRIDSFFKPTGMVSTAPTAKKRQATEDKKPASKSSTTKKFKGGK